MDFQKLITVYKELAMKINCRFGQIVNLAIMWNGTSLGIIYHGLPTFLISISCSH